MYAAIHLELHVVMSDCDSVSNIRVRCSDHRSTVIELSDDSPKASAGVTSRLQRVASERYRSNSWDWRGATAGWDLDLDRPLFHPS